MVILITTKSLNTLENCLKYVILPQIHHLIINGKF